MSVSSSDLIGVVELAEILGVTPRTIYNRRTREVKMVEQGKCAPGTLVPVPERAGIGALLWSAARVHAWQELMREKAFVGAVMRGHQWCPIVIHAGKTWRGNAAAALGAALHAAAAHAKAGADTGEIRV